MPKQFTTPKRSTRVIEFNIDDDTYHFTPAKIAGVMMPMLEPATIRDEDTAEVEQLNMTQATWGWLRDGLPHEVAPDVEVDEADRARPTKFATRNDALAVWEADQVWSPEYDRIMGRLNDQDDDLDFTDVAAVVRWLISQASGRPTGRRRG